MTEQEDDRPLLLREDLKVAALRAVAALPVLVGWVAVARGLSRAPARAHPYALAPLLAAVVGAVALVDLLARRRAWPLLRAGLVAFWVGALGGFAADLQARTTGLDLVAGDGEGRVAAALDRIKLPALERDLARPVAIGVALGLAALTLHAGWSRAATARQRGLLQLAVVAGAATTWLAAEVFVERPIGAAPSSAVRTLSLAAVLLVATLAGAWLVERRGRLTIEPRTPGPHGTVDLALGAGLVLLLLAPAGGRFVHDMRRAAAKAEAERRLQAALETPDPAAALAHLDVSIQLRDAPRARLERARRRAALQRWRDAEEDYEAAAAEGAYDEDEDRIAIRLEAHAGWADLVAGDFDRALTAIQKWDFVVETLRGSAELAEEHGLLLRRALAGRAAVHCAIDDDALAELDATALVEAEFGAADAHLRRGLIRLVGGQTDAGRDDVRRAADLGSAEARLWAAAAWGERPEAFDLLKTRTDWLGLAARALGDDVTPDERALLVAATAAGDDALATALAWLGAQAERTGDAARATERYTTCLKTRARGERQAARPGPGAHPGRLWAFRRLRAR